MARQIRKKSGTGVYHVMLRGINRQDIFEDEGDYQQMISILRGLVDRCDEHKVQLPPLCTFYAYCLMSNQESKGQVLIPHFIGKRLLEEFGDEHIPIIYKRLFLLITQ